MTGAMTEGTLFARLRAAAGPTWRSYCDHAFVRGLGDGGLPEAAFRHYLVQDYLFLIQFARAYALAAYKADDLDDMRAAAAAMSAIVDTEVALHVGYCRDWGLDAAAITAVPEDLPTTAYTRYVLDCGLGGDLLDLLVALAPCVVGYAEIGLTLAATPNALADTNRYRSWIEMYAGAEYQDVARQAVAQLDRVGARRGGEARFAALSRTFAQATRLEVAFWQMGLDAA